MGDLQRGVLLASIQMALVAKGPMTPNEIAAYLTRLNPNRPFSGSDVVAVLRSRPDLFTIDSRRFLGLAPPRWRLVAAAAGREADVAQLPRVPMGSLAPPPPKAIPNQPGISLIEDEEPASFGAAASTAELEALKLEVRRRQAKRGRIPFAPGRGRLRGAIDPAHPITKLADETLDRLASEVTPYIDSD